MKRRHGRRPVGPIVVGSAGLALLALLAACVWPGQTVITKAPALTLPGVSGVYRPDEVRVLEGLADPGATVQLFDGDELLGQVVTASDGTFGLTLPAELAAGPHSLWAAVPGTAERQTLQSAPMAVTILPPEVIAAPLITAPAEGADLVAGEVVLLEGKAVRGVIVRLLLDDSPLGATLADEAGRWRFVIGEGLTAGTHALRATVTSQDGQVATSPVVTVTATEPAAIGSRARAPLSPSGFAQRPAQAGHG